MKVIVLLVVCMLMVSLAVAELTTKEEDDVRALLAHKVELENLAKTNDLYKIPVIIDQLRKEREQIISDRDSEVYDYTVTYKNDVRTIEQTYEVLIDAKESEIFNYTTQLNTS